MKGQIKPSEWHTLVIRAHRQWMPLGQEFKFILSHIVSSRSTWTRDSILEGNKTRTLVLLDLSYISTLIDLFSLSLSLSLSLNLKNIYFILYVCFAYLYVCVYLYHVCPWDLPKLEEGIGSPGTVVTDGCELPCERTSNDPLFLFL
jgi:hypothetical protein